MKRSETRARFSGSCAVPERRAIQRWAEPKPRLWVLARQRRHFVFHAQSIRGDSGGIATISARGHRPRSLPQKCAPPGRQPGRCASRRAASQSRPWRKSRICKGLVPAAALSHDEYSAAEPCHCPLLRAGQNRTSRVLPNPDNACAYDMAAFPSRQDRSHRVRCLS
jgi:hypothetical protein